MDSSSFFGPPRDITMSERVPQSPWTLSECLTLVGPLRIFMSPRRPRSGLMWVKKARAERIDMIRGCMHAQSLSCV